MQPLTKQEISQALLDLPDWEGSQDELQRKYICRSFRDAVSLVNKIADIAEEQNHHPEMKCSFRKLKVTLSTHDAGDRVTQKDLELAKAIEEASKEFVAP